MPTPLVLYYLQISQKSEIIMNRSKSVILAMVLMGVFLGGFAWWARYTRSRVVLDKLGREAVVAIRTGKPVELLKLAKAPPDAGQGTRREDTTSAAESATEPVTTPTTTIADPLSVPGLSLDFSGSVDITDAPGLIHARHHLIHEKGYAWNEALPNDYVPEWDYALRFMNSGKTTTMLIDFTNRRALFPERQLDVSLQPILADALQKFFQTALEIGVD